MWDQSKDPFIFLSLPPSLPPVSLFSLLHFLLHLFPSSLSPSLSSSLSLPTSLPPFFLPLSFPLLPFLPLPSPPQLGKLVFDPLRGDSNSIYLGTSKTWSVAKYGSQLDAKADRKEFSMLWDVWSSLQDDGLTQ